MVNRPNDEVKKKKDFDFVFCFLLLQVRSEHSCSQQKEALELRKDMGRLVRNGWEKSGLKIIKSTVGKINSKNN